MGNQNAWIKLFCFCIITTQYSIISLKSTENLISFNQKNRKKATVSSAAKRDVFKLSMFYFESQSSTNIILQGATVSPSVNYSLCWYPCTIY